MSVWKLCGVFPGLFQTLPENQASREPYTLDKKFFWRKKWAHCFLFAKKLRRKSFLDQGIFVWGPMHEPRQQRDTIHSIVSCCFPRLLFSWPLQKSSLFSPLLILCWKPRSLSRLSLGNLHTRCSEVDCQPLILDSGRSGWPWEPKTVSFSWPHLFLQRFLFLYPKLNSKKNTKQKSFQPKIFTGTSQRSPFFLPRIAFFCCRNGNAHSAT